MSPRPLKQNSRRASENPLVRQLRALRSGPERRRRGLCYAEGNRIVHQALLAGVPIEQAVVAPEILTSDLARETLAALQAAGVPVAELSTAEFDRISFRGNPSGLGAVVRARAATLAGLPAPSGLGWVALAEVGNAGNLGALARTCAAVGATGLVLLGHTTDAYHPEAVKASMGALFHLAVMEATFAEFVHWKQEQGVFVVGAAGDAGQDFRQVTYRTPLVLLMGSERLGLNPEQQAACDVLASIPMEAGAADSLNLSVATSLFLYEIYRQRITK